MDQHRLGAQLLRSSSVERNLGVVVYKMSMSQHVIMAKEAKGIRGCIKESIVSGSGEVILHLCSALVRRIWSAVSSSESLSKRETWSSWSRSSGGQQI
ncbi:hypothetical protein DUI87_09979 [Hirundo rustica rustica]|uniref:Uncharacterized protein n=1 Tax=Hirundo rustica rustica TaxID=333673 RepID=A0A3M0KGY1_HIRRU|nr:hypothetical protein DUI87_09979 [Hirundo rustica rustica]